MRLASCNEFARNSGLEPLNTILLLSSLFERAHVTPRHASPYLTITSSVLLPEYFSRYRTGCLVSLLGKLRSRAHVKDWRYIIVVITVPGWSKGLMLLFAAQRESWNRYACMCAGIVVPPQARYVGVHATTSRAENILRRKRKTHDRLSWYL